MSAPHKKHSGNKQKTIAEPDQSERHDSYGARINQLFQDAIRDLDEMKKPRKARRA